MIVDALTGLRYFGRGFALIRRSRLRRYAVLPLIINIAVFAGLVWLGADWFEQALEDLLPPWLDFPVLRYLLWTLFAGAALLVVFYTFTLIANFIAAPFNGLLAENVEYALSGHKPPSSGRVLAVLGTIVDAMLTEVGKFLYLLAWMVPFAIIIFVPGLNLIAGPAWFLVSAWLLALEYLDYPASNHEIRFKELRRRARTRRWVVLGFGCGVVFLTAIPIINLFVMPAAVAGASALWWEQYQDPRLGSSSQRPVES